MKQKFVLYIFLLTTSVMSLFMTGCAYKLSNTAQTIPGNVQNIQIPLFKNKTVEPGVEIYFTNALKSEALRSRVARIENNESNAEAVLQGTITNIEVVAVEETITESNKESGYLPMGTLYATQYRVTANIKLELKKQGSNALLWSGDFVQSKTFPAAQITLPVINTSNSLYNQSAKRQTLDALSKEMMQAAFDRMLENF